MIRKLVFALLITLSIAGTMTTADAGMPFPECYPCID